MNTWEEVEQQPEFGLLTPEDKASLHNDWHQKVLSTLTEEDPEKVDAVGVNRFIATEKARNKALKTGTPLNEEAIADEPYQAEARVKSQKQTLADLEELERAQAAHKDADYLRSVAAMSEVPVPERDESLNREVEAKKQTVAALESRFTPEQLQQAKEAREALKGERPTAVLGSDLYTDPALVLDKDKYRAAVAASNASPEAKARAIADFSAKRQQVAAEALKTFRVAGESPLPGALDFPSWEATQPADVRKLPPEDKALRYMQTMQGRSDFRKLTSAIGTGLLQGGTDIASQGLGVAAMAAKSPELAKRASEVAEGANVLEETQKLEGDKQATGATTLGGASRLLPPMAAAIGAGAATGGVAALPVSAGLSGLQTAGAQFPTTFKALREQGVPEDKALEASRNAAITSGLITTAITAAFGKTGAEAALLTGAGGKELVKNRLVAALKATAKGAGAEIPEELLDEAATQVIEQRTIDPNKPVSQIVDEFAKTAPELAMQIALLGGAGGAIGSVRNTTTTPGVTPPVPGTTVQPQTPEDTDFARRAAMEGATEFRPNQGTPVQVEGTTIAHIPEGSPLTPEDVAEFADDPDFLKALARKGDIVLPEVVAPLPGVDPAITEELNTNIAASAALAPQTVEALKATQAEGAARNAAVIQEAAARLAGTAKGPDLGFTKQDILDERVRAAFETPQQFSPVTPETETPSNAANVAGGSQSVQTEPAGGSIPAVTGDTVSTSNISSTGEIQPTEKAGQDATSRTLGEAQQQASESLREAMNSGKGRFNGRNIDVIISPSSRPDVMLQITRLSKTGEPQGHQDIITEQDFEDAIADPDTLDVVLDHVRPDVGQGRVLKGFGVPKFRKPVLYKYRLRLRDAGLGTVPKGFVSAEGREVVYDHPLTLQEMQDFEMSPVGASAAPATTPTAPPTDETQTRPAEEKPDRGTAQASPDRDAESSSAAGRPENEVANPFAEPPPLQLNLPPTQTNALVSESLKEGVYREPPQGSPGGEVKASGFGDQLLSAAQEPRQVAPPASQVWQPTVNDQASFAVEGRRVIGTIREIRPDGKAVVRFNWNGKKDVDVVVPAARLSRPVASVAPVPNYQYTQEENTRKAGKHFPTAPGVYEKFQFDRAFASMAEDTSLSRMYREVARILSKMPGFGNVDLHIVADGRKGYAGEYSHHKGKSAIAVNLRQVARGKVDALGTLLHEALHHVTLAKVRDPQGAVETEAAQALDQIRQRVRAYAGVKEKAKKFNYELGSNEEFISALFTHPDFQDFLASIPDDFSPTTGASKFRSLLTEIFRRIAELVTGKHVAKGSTMEQSIASILALFETPHRTLDVGPLEKLSAKSLAGESAETPAFMRDSLDTAKVMAAAGKPSAEIRAVTGWFPGKYDGKMRWEIPDEGAEWKGPTTLADARQRFGSDAAEPTTRLGEVISHPALEKAYPGFFQKKGWQKVAVSFVDRMAVGEGQMLGNILEIGTRGGTDADRETFLKVALHEIQHWIQEVEGFAKGSSPDTFALLPLMTGNPNAANDAYNRTAGEIEARDVQARQKFTPEQRKAIEPYSSENIAKEDAIVMFGDTAASRANDLEFTVTQNRKSPGKEWLVSDGINTVEVYRDTDVGYLWFANLGGSEGQRMIATSKADAVKWAKDRLATMAPSSGTSASLAESAPTVQTAVMFDGKPLVAANGVTHYDLLKNWIKKNLLQPYQRENADEANALADELLTNDFLREHGVKEGFMVNGEFADRQQALQALRDAGQSVPQATAEGRDWLDSSDLATTPKSEAEPAEEPKFAFTRSRFAPPNPDDQLYQVQSDKEVAKKAFDWINAVTPLRAAELIMADRTPGWMDENTKTVAMGGLLKGFTDISLDPLATEDEKTVARATNQRLGVKWKQMGQDPARAMRQRGVQNNAVLQPIAPILAAEQVLADRGKKILDKQFDGGEEGAATRTAEAKDKADTDADERLENIISRLMGSMSPKQTAVGALAKMFRGKGQRDQIVDEVAKALMLKARGNVVTPERKTALANLVSSLKSTLAASVKGEKKPAPERTMQDLLTSAFVNQVSEGATFEEAWKEGRQKVLDMLIDIELDKTFHPAEARLKDLRARLAHLEAGSAEQQKASAAEREQLAAQIASTKADMKTAMDAVKAMTPALETQRDGLMPATPTVAFDPTSAKEAIGRAFEQAGYTAELDTGLDKNGKRALSIKDALLNRTKATEAVMKQFDEAMATKDADTQRDWPQARPFAEKAVKETLDAWQKQMDEAKVAKLEATKQNLLSEDSKALEKLVNSIRAKIAPDADWSDILQDLPRTQAERLAAIKERVAKHEALKNLTPDEATKLAENVDKLWQRERLKAFQDELLKAGVLKAKTTKAAVNVASVAPELIRLMNLGVFNSGTFREAVSKRFGIKQMSNTQADALRRLAAQAWELPQGVLRNKKLKELVEGLQHVTGSSWSDTVSSYWAASVLSGLNTQFNTWMAVLNGLSTNLIQAGGQLVRGHGAAAIGAQQQWWRALGQGMSEAGHILWTGDTSFTKRFESDILDALNGEKGVHPIAIGEKMWKNGTVMQKIPGALMMMVGRSMVAADHINNTATTQGAMAIARAMNPELYDGKTSWTQAEINAARAQALQETTAGEEPTTLEQRTTVSARTREILNAGVKEEDRAEASNVGDIAAFQNEPTGLFGGLYRSVKAGLSTAVRGLEKKAQDEEATKLVRAICAVGAGSVYAATGTRFMRYGFNIGNEYLRYMPGSWVLNKVAPILGSNLSPMQQEMLLGKNLVGAMILGTLYAMFGGDDEEKDGQWQLEGPWDTLSAEDKASRRSAGLAPNTMWVRKDGKIHRVSYGQWAAAGVIGAAGSMLDEKRYKPEEWKQRGPAGHMLRGAVTGLFQVQNVAALENLAKILGAAPSNQQDKISGPADRLAEMGTAYAGGFAPTFLKDLDKWDDPRNFKAEGAWEKLIREMPVARRFVQDGRAQFNRLGEDVRVHREPYSRLYTADEISKAQSAYANLISRGVDFPNPSTDRKIFKDGKKVPMDSLGKQVAYDFEKSVALAYGKYLAEHGEELKKLPTRAADKVVQRKAALIIGVEARKVQAKVNNP